jgi:protein SCO1/2
MRQWIIVIVALAIAGTAGLWVFENRPSGQAPAQTGLLGKPSETIGGPFSLIDQSGRHVTQKSWPGKYLLIYFGYTFCPDACPTELLAMSQAMDELPEDKAAKLQMIFITIDPARDTTAKLNEYVPSFHPNLEGLTGSDADIAAVAKEYQVYYQKNAGAGNGNDYVMDHSSYVYLVNPAGKTIGIFSSDTSYDDLAKALDSALE